MGSSSSSAAAPFVDFPFDISPAVTPRTDRDEVKSYDLNSNPRRQNTEQQARRIYFTGMPGIITRKKYYARKEYIHA